MSAAFLGSPSGAGAVASASRSPRAPGRAKRHQVSRACDSCRIHRIKCDNQQPCSNCRSRKSECTSTGANEIRNLPHAFREIERLKSRVQELEKELEMRDTGAPLLTPSRSPGSSIGTQNQASLIEGAVVSAERPVNRNTGAARSKHSWGFYPCNSQLPQKQWFGPSSLFYFIHRMSSHLGTFIENPPAENTIHFRPPEGESLTEGGPRQPSLQPDHPLDPHSAASSTYYLTAMQEEYFLSYFWQSWHCAYQVVDETSFRNLYRSLWTNGKSRKPSALVDIILALCIHLDTLSPPSTATDSQPSSGTDFSNTNFYSSTMNSASRISNNQHPNDTDLRGSIITGRWHYQRCQTLLISELENPTISTLQCQLLSVVYLCCSSFQNMAYSLSAQAIRTAQILGFHLEPSPNLPESERELRKRIWWTLCINELKTCLKLGRPLSEALNASECSLPSDDHHVAIQSGSAALVAGNATWLSYTVQHTKLVLAIHDVYTDFYDECARLIALHGLSSIYDSQQVLEACAQRFKSRLDILEDWTRHVPDGLKAQRVGEGQPFSTDGTALALQGVFAPLWLQRQRLFLELTYHNLCIVLYRAMISFSHNTSPIVEECATHGVNHAITLTVLTHQAVSETELLKGWQEAFQWQWNAAIIMVGYLLAYPLSPASAVARSTLSKAIEVFEVLGKQFAVGIRAADVVQCLFRRIEYVLQNGQAGLAGPLGQTLPLDSLNSELASMANGFAAGMDSMVGQSELGNPYGLQDVLTGTMDLAFSVDSVDRFEVLDPSSFNFSEFWMFPTE